MKFTLLTGATGLLGRYLMRDMLVRGQNLVVLVRPSRLESPQARIDSILLHWEESWLRSLPRPVVLEGDITKPGLGLCRDDRQWLRDHCDNVLHSAASLTFYEEGGEPWRSNVEGVRHLLDLCREAEIGIVRQVSSAYTCGLRTGTVYETELDEGQKFGNDYEVSKVQAEELVRSAEHLDAYTVFRPSIIVGDSNNGFSSTFHGFYTPLRLLCAMLVNTDVERLFETNYLKLLGMAGGERKNFVPVEWVSDAMVSISERRPDCNQTYALVTKRPIDVGRLFQAFEESVRRYGIRPRGNGSASPSNLSTANGNSPPRPAHVSNGALSEPLDVYRSYWRDDPRFDDAHTRNVISDKPAPELTDEVLVRLCGYAIKNRFACAYRRPVSTKSLLREMIEHWPIASGAGDVTDEMFRLSVTGTGGGSWLFCPDGDGFTRQVGGSRECGSEIRTNAKVYDELAASQLSVDAAVASGRVLIIGNQQALGSFQNLVRSTQNAKDLALVVR